MLALVSGSSGFIGQHLVNQLKIDKRFDNIKKIIGISRKAQLYPWDINLHNGKLYEEINCNLAEDLSVSTVLSRYKPDIIFHLGGIATISNSNPFKALQNNVSSTHHLLEYAPTGCKFVFTSSATVYGDFNGSVFNEDSPLQPTSSYGISKLACEKLIKNYTKQKNFKSVILRLAATVGKNANHGFIPDLIRKVKADKPSIELIGECPGSIKPYTHVSDVIEGILHFSCLLSERPEKDCRTINLANSDFASIESIANLAKKQMLRDNKYISWKGKNSYWYGDNILVKIDNNLAKGLGWQQRYPTSLEAVSQAIKDIEG